MKLRESEKTTVSYATLLSLTEVGLGSVLHAMHIPFTGQLLSLNQIAVLSHATKMHPEKSAPLTISVVAALLKSLSPIGKRLTPMLALTMQGLLFTFGIFVAGRTVFGRIIGAFFTSLWSFIQPALLYSLIFGENFWKAAHSVNAKFLPEGMLMNVLIAIIIIKVVLGIVVAIMAPRLSLQFFEKLSSQVSPEEKKREFSIKKQLWFSLKDLFKPLFLLSLAMVTFLFVTTYTDADSLGLMLLRPIAVGYLVSVALRLIPVEKLLSWLEARTESRFQRVLKATLETVR